VGRNANIAIATGWNQEQNPTNAQFAVIAEKLEELKQEVLNSHPCGTGGYPAWIAREDLCDLILEELVAYNTKKEG